MVWWIILGIFVFLLILPLGASIFYDKNGVRVLVIAGPVRITVFPVKKKTKDKPEETEKTEEKQPEEIPQPPQEEKKNPQTPLPDAPKPPEEPKQPDGGSLTDFLPLVELALKFVGEFFHKTIHIDVLYVKMTMAGDDPADLAISYGNTWAALGNLWPYIDRMFTIKKRDIQVQCDFEAKESLVNARVDLTLTLGRIFGLVLSYGIRILIKFLKIQNTRKNNNQKKKTANNHKAVQ